MLTEHYFACPWCGETVSVLLDLSVPDQEYIEDCEVCCNPMALRVRADAGEVRSFEATQA